MTLQSARYHTLACHQHFFSPDAAAPSFLGGSGEDKCVSQGRFNKAGYFSWAAAKSGSDWKNPETSSQTVFDPGSPVSAATIDVTEAEKAASRGETRVDSPNTRQHPARLNVLTSIDKTRRRHGDHGRSPL